MSLPPSPSSLVRSHFPSLSPSFPSISLESPEFSAFCTDRCLERYHTAFNGDSTKAAKGVLETFQWRLQYGFPRVFSREFSPELSRLMFLAKGKDKLGRPILINRKNENALEESQIRDSIDLIVYTLERGASEADDVPGDGKWLWILDLEKYSRKSRTPFHVTREVLGILMNHYPERLYKAFILDAPFLFSGLWRLISPFLDKRTKDKIQFINNRKSPEFQSLIGQYIEIDQLEEDFGGKNSFDFSSYWANCPWRRGKTGENEEEKEIKENISETGEMKSSEGIGERKE